MASFNIAHDNTIKNEGEELSLHKEDSGNWTGGKINSGVLIGSKWGIAAPTLSAFLGRIATADEMKNLSYEKASLIYKKNYWDKIKGGEINNQEEANSIYDSAVNMGPSTAIKLAQKVLGIKETGVMDILTLNKLNNK